MSNPRASAPAPARSSVALRAALAFAALTAAAAPVAPADGIPDSCRQLIVAKAPDWSSHRASLAVYERESAKKPWKPAFKSPIPALLGRNGMAWGRGVKEFKGGDIPPKREGDKKAPAGIFKVGAVFGYAKALPEGSDPRYPYRQVTEWDAWVDDPENPHYNRHYVANPKNVPAWFSKQKMRHGDFAYAWLLEIRHNADPPVPGFGSAIFFHIRRGEDRPTAGCTTMKKEDLESILKWLRHGSDPHYVLLPAAEYEVKKSAWKLP
ncbi:MAG: L,D-transpeptidase family protein [Verrucomicrobiales bacterium]